jgi:hypothetical protein
MANSQTAAAADFGERREAERSLRIVIVDDDRVPT